MHYVRDLFGATCLTFADSGWSGDVGLVEAQ